MIKLPKTKGDPKETEHAVCNPRRFRPENRLPRIQGRLPRWFNLCAEGYRCLPVCKSRRREWKGEIQNTSAELLLEREPLPVCFRRWPTKIYPNGPCPLFGRTRRITINERYKINKPKVVRICQAPLEDTVDTPYVQYAQMAKDIGAWGAVKACCAFCECGACCPCGIREYVMHDAERAARRRSDMRSFDKRVKTDHQIMRIMYDKM